MEQVKELTYQGVAPWMLWVTAVVIVALCVAFAAVWKIVQINRDEKKRKQDEMRAIAERVFEEKASVLAEKISKTVADGMKDKFAEIDRKLDNDKRHIEGAERRGAEHDKTLERMENTLDSVDKNIRDMQRGFTYLARGNLATLNHQLQDGDTDDLISAREELNRYLTDRYTAPMNESKKSDRRNDQ